MKPNEELLALRKFGVLVLASLLAINALMLGVFYGIEEGELRNELMQSAQKIENGGREYAFVRSQESAAPERPIDLPDGVVVFQGHNEDARANTFSESRFSGTTYLVYATPHGLMVAKSDDDIRAEIKKIAVLLAIVSFAQCVLLVGWWMLLRTRVRSIFEV